VFCTLFLLVFLFQCVCEGSLCFLLMLYIVVVVLFVCGAAFPDSVHVLIVVQCVFITEFFFFCLFCYWICL
jgi:hypothetical protein